MLTRAIHESAAASGRPTPNPPRAQFPPRGQAAVGGAVKTNGFRHPQMQTRTLHPTPSSSSNGPRLDGQARTQHASEWGAGSSSDAYDSTAPSRTRASYAAPPSTAAGSGILGKLHESVFFDENDFVDDADLDLDADDSFAVNEPPDRGLYPSLPQSTNLYPILPAVPDPATTRTSPKSSVPIPWSSSPLHHKNPRPDPAPPRTEPPGRAGLDPGDEREPWPRPVRRRGLPWLETALDESPNAGGGQGPQAGIDHRKKRARMDASTPLPKEKDGSPYPWNTTASAVKEEQKKHRQQANQGKKIAKTVESDWHPAKAKRKGVAQVFLSEEQRKVLDLVTNNQKSVFFTGSAGTGKSVLMREIIQKMRKKYERESDRVAVTASTGLAACNIGGITLHSFAGIGLGKEPTETLVKRIKKNSKALTRWQRTRVLIIDEISMVDGKLFDKLEQIARTVRRKATPFGGIQLVITGDFFQLPPVPDGGQAAKFAFDAASWQTSIDHTIGLTQVFRQKDPVFAGMLNEMRLGTLSQRSIETFRKLDRPLEVEDSIEATELFPTRQEVDAANATRMRSLEGSPVEFKAEDSGSIKDVEARTRLLSNCMAPASLKLKRGAQVMLIKNLDESLVNGSIGKVEGFMDEQTYSLFEKVESGGTAGGEAGPKTKPATGPTGKADVAGNTGWKWPYVRFQIADGTSRGLLLQRETWKTELPNGEVQACRSQVPLILAWALSIHKAQGQTLERVKVDLGKIFEKGQAYVALSRATCQDGLQIRRFDPKKIMAHDRVREFYTTLYNIDRASGSGSAAPKAPPTAHEPRFAPEDDDNEEAEAEMEMRYLYP